MFNRVLSLYKVLSHPLNCHHLTLTLFRLLFWKINQLFFHLPAIVNLDNHTRCICYPDSSYGGMIVYNRFAEYDVMQGIISHLKKGSIYFDVGANIGDTTLIATTHTGHSIYAFEPSPVAYPRLLENIRLNDLGDRIVTEQSVLSDHCGNVNFVDTITSETSHLSTSYDHSPSLTIKSTTLDQYVADHRLPRIDLIKIDVEGAEMLVLLGAIRLLQKHQIKQIILELNFESQNYGYTNTDIINYLTGFGYTIFTLSNYKRLNPRALPTDFDQQLINIYATLSQNS